MSQSSLTEVSPSGGSVAVGAWGVITSQHRCILAGSSGVRAYAIQSVGCCSGLAYSHQVCFRSSSESVSLS